MMLLRHILNLLMLWTRRLLLPLVIGRLFRVIELRLPLRRQRQSTAALRHLLQCRDILIVDQRELRYRMITIRAGTVQPLEIHTRTGVRPMTSLLPAFAHNLHIVLEWYVVVAR